MDSCRGPSIGRDLAERKLGETLQTQVMTRQELTIRFLKFFDRPLRILIS
jgi:hypothetical protein